MTLNTHPFKQLAEQLENFIFDITNQAEFITTSMIFINFKRIYPNTESSRAVSTHPHTPV